MEEKVELAGSRAVEEKVVLVDLVALVVLVVLVVLVGLQVAEWEAAPVDPQEVEGEFVLVGILALEAVLLVGPYAVVPA